MATDSKKDTTKEKSGDGQFLSPIVVKWGKRIAILITLGMLWFYRAELPLINRLSRSNQTPMGKNYPVNPHSPDIQLTWKNPQAEMEVCENAFSGLILIPPDTRFVVYAPGDVVLRFTTKKGEKDYFVRNHEANLSYVFPGYVFRIRGTPGKAKIYLSKT